MAELVNRCDERQKQNEHLLLQLEVMSTKLESLVKLLDSKDPVADELFGALEATGGPKSAETDDDDLPAPPVEALSIREEEDAPSMTSPTVDFTGTWVLATSVRFKEYLEATGVPWAKRQLAASFKPVQTWTRYDAHGSWEVAMQTPLGPKKERLEIGAQSLDEIDGLQVTKESRWEGAELVTQCRPLKANGSQPQLTEFRRRYDSANDQIILEIVTGHAKCTRIFSRQR